MGSFTYRLSFRATHPDADLSVVSDALGVPPSRLWRAGEPRTTPTGGQLAGVNKVSYCTIPLDQEPGTPLPDAIASVLKRLRAERRILDPLAASGGSFNFFVGWFTDGNSGEILDWHLLKDLADLKISLDMDVYDGPQWSRTAEDQQE